MPHATDEETLALTGLRLRSVSPVAALATTTGVPAERLAGLLEGLERRGLVQQRHGALAGWDLTEAGRVEGEHRLAAELDRTGTRPTVDDAYRRFRRLNPELLAACTDWQVRSTDGAVVINDHTDAAHDAAAVARLGAVDDQAQPICADLAAALDRFATYGPRLAAARRRVEAGEGDWFTRLTIDSYHTVWFELHEHLLASLGLQRADEDADEHDAHREAS